MIKTARQLKDLIRNLAREKSADAQILMRNYMMERFLERISLSEYRDNFILKGGMLVAAMVRLDARSTMNLDATVQCGDDVLAYYVRQSFVPGELTPEEASRLGVEFAKQFTK